MRLKNVIIINDFNYIQGGASKVAIDTAKLLNKNNINVIFFSAVSGENDKINGIQYISTEQHESIKEKNKIKGFVNGIYNIKARKEFKKILKKMNPEDTIIHIHGWTKALSSSVFDIAYKMKFKIVFTLHDYFTACPNGGYFNYVKNDICQYMPLSKQCIKCNCDSRNYFFKLYRLIRQVVQNKIVKMNSKIEYVIGISDLSIKILSKTLPSKAHIEKIYNPIDFNIETQVNWSENNYYLYVGRVSKEKGVEMFCKAITEMNLCGIVVGDGNELDRLKNKYKNISFVGWKEQKEVKEYIKNARCLIFPSLWYEGAPLTPLESMSYGIPCLVNSKCAGKEYCESNNFETFDELKFKLMMIEKNIFIPGDYKILENFKPEKYISDLLKYYEYILIN